MNTKGNLTPWLILALGLLVLVLLWPASVRADAQAGLAAYERGDYKTAYREWLPLAEQGYAEAQYNLGVMYAKGQGVPQDDAEAVKWYRLAANQGYARAQTNLGFMYEKGRGVPKHDAEAVHWYRLAAEQGYSRAETRLGRFYGFGIAVPKDFVTAYAWYYLAASQGYEKAAERRDLIQKKMTHAQVADAEKLGAEMIARSKKNLR